jgi:hypothetical protein
MISTVCPFEKEARPTAALEDVAARAVAIAPQRVSDDGSGATSQAACERAKAKGQRWPRPITTRRRARITSVGALLDERGEEKGADRAPEKARQRVGWGLF